MKNTLLIALTLLLLPSLSLAEDELKIGVIQSTTGIAAEDGKTVVQALQLASDKLRQDGIEIQLLFEDDQTNPSNTVSAYQNLKAKGVDVIIGATWDFTTNTLMFLAGRDKLILFNTSCLPESLQMDKANGYAFSNAVPTFVEASPFSEFLQRNKAKSMVTVYANNSWGETQRRIYRELAKKLKVDKIHEYSSVSFDKNEWRTILPLIKAKNPDVVLLLLNKNDLSVFVRRAKETEFKTRFFASKNALDAVRASKSPSLFEGLCFTYPYEQLRSHGHFSEEYKARFREEPRIYADNTYDALFLLAKAYRRSKSKSISFREALMETEFKGLVGTYRYSKEASFSLGTSSMLCVENGELRLLNSG